MDKGAIAAARAVSALGAPFCLNGANPGSGFDCVGLTAFCYGLDPTTPPRRTGLGRVSPEVWHSALSRAGFVPAETPSTGDLLLLDCGRGRWHLAVAVERGLIHAHAGLRRVVHAASPDPMTVLARYSQP